MEQANVYRELKLIRVNNFVELKEGKAFCVSPEIADAGGPFPEVAPAAERCWDKAERGITAQQQESRPRNFQSARAVFMQTSVLQESHAWLLPD